MVVPADLDVVEGVPAAGQKLHRWLVAQEFLDHPGGQIGFVTATQPVEYLGVAQEGEHAVGDEVDGRLVAA